MRHLPAVFLLGAAACSTPASTPSAPVSTSVSAPLAAPEREPQSLQAERRTTIGKPLSTLDRAELFACWFERPYSYMFEGGSEGEGAAAYGRFMAGISGIMDYGGLSPCAGKIHGPKQVSFSDASPIAAMAGLPLYSPAMNDERPFGYYNPDLVRWGHENLIPSRDEPIAGASAAQIYDRVFVRFFRTMARTYVVLHDEMQFEAEQQAYVEHAIVHPQNPYGAGLDYLESRFSGVVREDEGAFDGTQMTSSMAFGFWLRRGMDGTEPELWIGLKKVLHDYDTEFFAGLQRAHPRARVEWAVAR